MSNKIIFSVWLFTTLKKKHLNKLKITLLMRLENCFQELITLNSKCKSFHIE